MRLLLQILLIYVDENQARLLNQNQTKKNIATPVFGALVD